MALRHLLIQCVQANEAEALETLRLNLGIINDPWDGEDFEISDDRYLLQGDTAIMAASLGGSEGLVRELVRLGAKVNARVDGGWDALILASNYGHTAVVAMLLDNGADMNVRDKDGSGALMRASCNGHPAVVAMLLDNGADPNTRDRYGSALGFAAFCDHLPVCQLLLGRGADLLAVNAYHRGKALEVYGFSGSQRLTPAISEERREALRVAFAEGPLETQRRRDERWVRRWPFMLVLAGTGFRPLEVRRLEMALRLLSVSEPSGGEAAGAPLTRRDECVRIVFRADNLVRLIVSFL